MKKACIVCERLKDQVLAEYCEWACDTCRQGKGPKKGTHAPQIHNMCLSLDLDWKVKGMSFDGKSDEPVEWHCPACYAQVLELPADSESPAEPAPAAPAPPPAPELPQPEAEDDASAAPAPPAPAAPAAPAPAAPAPAPALRADSKNVPPVTQDEPADEAVSDSTEDLAPPPKRARVSELKDCLEALRDKLGKVARQTFDVDDAWAWCDEKGAENISDIVELEYVDAFVAHLGLKDIPARRLKQILKEEFA